MNCNEIRPLLEANCDGELDPVRGREIEEHLRSCPGCAAAARTAEERRKALRRSLPRFTAPPGLRERILALTRAPEPAAARREPSRWPMWNLGGMAAAAALALALGYELGASKGRARSVVDEAVSEHIRSLEAGHLMDVVSTDQHTVKPWFAGKVDFSPPVADLADAGFPLSGGRLDRIDGRPAAALVFHRRLHAINLFIWPGGRSDLPPTGAENGYNVRAWSQGSLDFLAVSEIPGADLDQFVAEFRRRTE
jgi:anti-sigma factor RsiW